MAIPINIEDLLNKHEQKNGSPRATIETNEERSFINIFIPIHGLR